MKLAIVLEASLSKRNGISFQMMNHLLVKIVRIPLLGFVIMESVIVNNIKVFQQNAMPKKFKAISGGGNTAESSASAVGSWYNNLKLCYLFVVIMVLFS